MGYDSDKWDRRAAAWSWIVVCALAVVLLVALIGR
jgi:hypothetical protein